MTIDSYAHIGLPRFLGPEQTLAALERDGSDRAVLVLGPGHPDLASLIAVHRLGAQRVRTIGVPYGETAELRAICVRCCLDAGAIGIRMQRDEAVDSPEALALIGERGGWIFATDPLQSPRHSRCLLDWLERWPQGRIAAPHFLGRDCSLLEGAEAAALLAHERFVPILSRHGGASREADPHLDLRPWVERVVAACGWDRLLWGGELPVLYWRDETIPQARGWIDRLGLELTPDQRHRFFHANAERLFFAAPAPPCTLLPEQIPSWIAGFQAWPLRLLGGALQLQPEPYQRLLQAYHQELGRHPSAEQPRLSAFIAATLDRALAPTVQRSTP